MSSSDFESRTQHPHRYRKALFHLRTKCLRKRSRVHLLLGAGRETRETAARKNRLSVKKHDVSEIFQLFYLGAIVESTSDGLEPLKRKKRLHVVGTCMKRKWSGRETKNNDVGLWAARSSGRRQSKTRHPEFDCSRTFNSCFRGKNSRQQTASLP